MSHRIESPPLWILVGEFITIAAFVGCRALTRVLAGRSQRLL